MMQKGDTSTFQIRASMKLTTQLSEHCRFLHQHKTCHRDIKPSNLAIDDEQNLVVLDCDLMQQFLQGSIVHSFRGTKEFSDPEYYSYPESGFDVYQMGAVFGTENH